MNSLTGASGHTLRCRLIICPLYMDLTDDDGDQLCMWQAGVIHLCTISVEGQCQRLFWPRIFGVSKSKSDTPGCTITRFHQNRNYKFVNNKQRQATNIVYLVCAHNLPMLGVLTTKPGTLMDYDKFHQNTY